MLLYSPWQTSRISEFCRPNVPWQENYYSPASQHQDGQRNSDRPIIGKPGSDCRGAIYIPLKDRDGENSLSVDVNNLFG